MKTVSETSGDMHEHSHYGGGSQKENKEGKTWENIWRDKTWKIPKHGKENNQPGPGSTESPRQNKTKEENTETHNNQTDKNWRQK